MMSLNYPKHGQDLQQLGLLYFTLQKEWFMFSGRQLLKITKICSMSLPMQDEWHQHGWRFPFRKRKKKISMFQWVTAKKAKLQRLHSSSSPCNKLPPSDDELTKPTCLNLRCTLEKSWASRRLKQWKQSVEIMASEAQTYKPPTCRDIMSLSQTSPQ